MQVCRLISRDTKGKSKSIILSLLSKREGERPKMWQNREAGWVTEAWTEDADNRILKVMHLILSSILITTIIAPVVI